MKVLHFTLGPVQSFVEQARRTRDLWAGSFLLAYLSGQAMKTVLESDGGEVVFPHVGTRDHPRDSLLAAILGDEEPNPEIGSLPNRFKAAVPDGFEPERCRDAVQDAWQAIADSVWAEFVAPVAAYGNDTEAIWTEQVSGFWEMAWICDDDPGDASDAAWLDARKNWRTHRPPEQGGDHCTLMGEWTELSGYGRAQNRKAQDGFWDAMRSQPQLNMLDLRPNERLCAIALIKRLYPRRPEATIGWELDVEHWPSTTYMAAIPWLERAHNTQAAQDYLAQIEAEEGSQAFSEAVTELDCLRNAGRFAQLGGDFCYEETLESEQRSSLKEAVKKVNEAVGQAASPFYALLLMDGDHLGRLLRDHDEAEISDALSTFTARVGEMISEKCGKTVYAGGDDVLALLPLDRALDAACELRQAYRETFPANPDATISGAVVLAHYNVSLRAVLDEAHRQLEEEAKAGNGRDSLAITVLSSSGRNVAWVSTWTDASDHQLMPELLLELSQHFADESLSSAFVYNVRRRLGPLLDDEQRLVEGLDLKDVLLAEHRKSREGTLAEAEEDALMETLAQVCRRRWRDPDSGEPGEDPASLLIDGALLARFLANQEVRDAGVPA